MATSFPAELAAFHDDPVAHHLPDGEDPDDAAARFVTCLEDIAAEHPEGRVLVVAHTTAIRLAVCRMLGIPLGDYRRVFPAVGNCALTEVRLARRAGLDPAVQHPASATPRPADAP